MQCPKCGHNLPKNIVFCGKCGADLSKTKKKQKKGCRTFLINVVLMFALGIVIGVLANHAESSFVLGNNTQKEFIQDDSNVKSAAEVQDNGDAQDAENVQGDTQVQQEEAIQSVTEEYSETQINEEQEETDISEQLIQSIESAANGKAVYSKAADYDEGGTTEVFAIIGSANENDGLFGNIYMGEIWFANPEEVYRVKETDIYYASSVDVLKFGQTSFFVAQKAVMTGGFVCMWGTENSKAVETPVSGQVSSINTIEKVSENYWTFTVEQSAYDGSADGSGHTWKPYYFYWDGEFHEYGGKILTVEEFCTYGGAEEILNEITSAGNTCTEILYRGNGLIHINFHSPEGFNENATLKLESGNVQLLSAYSDNPSENLLSSSYGGIYMAAMIPEIAVYP